MIKETMRPDHPAEEEEQDSIGGPGSQSKASIGGPEAKGKGRGPGYIVPIEGELEAKLSEIVELYAPASARRSNPPPQYTPTVCAETGGARRTYRRTGWCIADCAGGVAGSLPLPNPTNLSRRVRVTPRCTANWTGAP